MAEQTVRTGFSGTFITPAGDVRDEDQTAGLRRQQQQSNQSPQEALTEAFNDLSDNASTVTEPVIGPIPGPDDFDRQANRRQQQQLRGDDSNLGLIAVGLAGVAILAGMKG